MREDTLKKLCEWYQAQCNGKWEHEYGLRIDTVDNPGWTLEIDLAGTSLEGRSIAGVAVDNSDKDWHVWETRDRKFVASGDPAKLPLLLEKFLEFSTSFGPTSS